MKIKEFDVFVIGSGSAGRTVAETCAKNGLKVAIADNRVYGGTCPNRGCDPKKVLLGATEVWETANKLKEKGVTTTPKLDWKRLQKFKRTFTKAVPAATESNLKDLGIQLYHQSPIFIDGNTLSVEGKTVRSNKIVIATGQVPRELDFEGSKHLKTSDDFLNLKKIPKSILFIGAGYIGMELAHMAARAGSKVTLLERGDRPLKAFDSDLVSHLTNVSKDLGIQFIFNSEIKKIEKLRKNLKVYYKGDGKTRIQKVRMIFNTAGRIPSTSALNLEKGNVTFSAKGIKVNSYLQSTSNPKVYACGDVSDHSLPLTPLSGIEGHTVAENILHGNKKKITIPVVPSAVFTLPNLASVGLSEDEAKKRYKNVTINYESVPDWFNARRLQEPAYAYKIISNSRTKAIVGAHLLSGNAAETINLFAMAITSGTTTEDLKKMIFTYPSWCNDIKSMV
jgi:glutathione reductase (NADPH)